MGWVTGIVPATAAFVGLAAPLPHYHTPLGHPPALPRWPWQSLLVTVAAAAVVVEVAAAVQQQAS